MRASIKSPLTLSVIAFALALALMLSAPGRGGALASPSGALFAPFSTLGSPLSCLGVGPCGTPHPLAGMSPEGKVTLAWLSVIGGATSVKSAVIRRHAAHAGPAVTLSRGPSAIAPALAVSPSGRAAVAWFQLRHPTAKPTGRLAVAAIQVRERPPDGVFGAPKLVWRASRSSDFPYGDPISEPYGEGDIQIALDKAGDEVIAWETSMLMVVTRKADGTFSKPIVLGPASGHPAVTVSQAGQVTLLWARSRTDELLVSTWSVGAEPAAPVVLQKDAEANPDSEDGGFSDIQLHEDAGGDEIAIWLEWTRRPTEYGGKRDEISPEVMNAAWRSAGNSFAKPQTVSGLGLAPLESTVALRSDGRALLVWTEITGIHYEPNGHAEPRVLYDTQLDYSQASPGGPFATAISVPGPPGAVATGPAAAWLGDGTALIAEKHANKLLITHLTDGGIFSPFTQLSEGEGIDVGVPTLVANGMSNPVVVWASEYREWPVHYAIGNGLDGPMHEAVAPILEELSHKQNIYARRGVVVVVRCDERCRLTVTAHLFREAETANESLTLAGIGRFPPLHRTLPADHRTVFKIPASPRQLKAVCSNKEIGIEVHLTARGLKSGLVRTVTEGGTPEELEPSADIGCPSPGA